MLQKCYSSLNSEEDWKHLPWDLELKMVHCGLGSNLEIDFMCLITGKEFWVLKSEFFFQLFVDCSQKQEKRHIFCTKICKRFPTPGTVPGDTNRREGL